MKEYDASGEPNIWVQPQNFQVSIISWRRQLSLDFIFPMPVTFVFYGINGNALFELRNPDAKKEQLQRTWKLSTIESIDWYCQPRRWIGVQIHIFHLWTISVRSNCWPGSHSATYCLHLFMLFVPVDRCEIISIPLKQKSLQFLQWLIALGQKRFCIKFTLYVKPIQIILCLHMRNICSSVPYRIRWRHAI